MLSFSQLMKKLDISILNANIISEDLLSKRHSFCLPHIFPGLPFLPE